MPKLRTRPDPIEVDFARSAIVVVDIMRIKDGVFQEHWDVSEGEPTEDESKSKRPVFGDGRR